MRSRVDKQNREDEIGRLGKRTFQRLDKDDSESSRVLLCIRLKELGGWFGQGYLDTRARGTLDGCHVVLLQE